MAATPSAASVIRALRALTDPVRAKVSASFFKTGPGQYGEGDVFWGVTVPRTRAVIKTHPGLPMSEIEKLLEHGVHEVRLAGWLALVAAYVEDRLLDDGDRAGLSGAYIRSDSARQDVEGARGAMPHGMASALESGGKSPRGAPLDPILSRREIFDFYLAHARRADNWDLVDVSAPNVVGDFLLDFSDADRTDVLRRLASSDCVWERRVAVLATFAFIRAGRFHPAVAVCRGLLRDPHDLIHKACGWMLREMGKRGGLTELRAFLTSHAARMPRTMLRYAIERLEPAERARWMGMRE